VFRYNPGKSFEETFTRFDMKSGLSHNNILSVCSDNDTTLWLLSGNGISAMNTEGRYLFDLKEQNFEFSSYASDNRYPHELFFNAAKNEILVAVSGGLLIHPLQKEDSLMKFPIVITNLTANDKLISIPEIKPAGYRLPYRSNSISIEFAGLYYGTFSGLQYEYKLDGYDKEWINAKKDFVASYQNLPPGNYHFYVRALDNKGRVVSELSGISFRIIPPFWRTGWFIAIVILLALFMIWLMIRSLRINLKMERMINSFATSLYGQNTTDDIFWDTARNCIEKLGFIDCVIYQRDESRNVLVQKAAFGPKNPGRREIVNIIEIPMGKGIVGSVAQSGKGVIISDTTRDPRYIVDDEKRKSEITVPILVDGKVFAVIDSEHPRKRFYKKFHLRILKKIAAICAERITRHLTEERLRIKIARDMHDEMGSTLTSINIISKVAMEEKQDPAKVNQNFQKIKDHSGRMMESMSDMVWAINPVNDNFEKVILRMKEFAAEILEPARINYYFYEEGDLERVHLNLQQRKEMYLIFKEAINNIVKYSEAKEVNITFQLDENSLKMRITDNGNGFDIKLESSGNGLKNMRSRSAEMGASIIIDSKKGTGTSILLELPVT
jgi:signal transduction histidine kinase